MLHVHETASDLRVLWNLSAYRKKVATTSRGSIIATNRSHVKITDLDTLLDHLKPDVLLGYFFTLLTGLLVDRRRPVVTLLDCNRIEKGGRHLNFLAGLFLLLG